MEVIHTIERADVGDGVYRHPMNSPQRALLVAISWKFGGIGPADVGRKVYRAKCGALVWEGSHPNAPVSEPFRSVNHAPNV